MSKQIESNIKCPFYISEREVYIKSEGIIPGTTVITSFLNKQVKTSYELAVCSVNNENRCSIYRELECQYDRGLRR